MKRKLNLIAVILGSILVLASLLVFINGQINLAKEKKVMTGFETLLDKEDVTPAELIQYINENIGDVSKESAATLVRGLEVIQKVNLAQWEKKFENTKLQQELGRIYQENGWNLGDLSGISDEKLKAIVNEAINNGYKVETAEGFFFPIIDYTLYDEYHQAVTPDLEAYFAIMAVESDQTPVKDAALMISWEEILNRALRQEEFIKEYGTSTQIKPMKELLKRYATFALFGANNTPLFSYDNKEMNSKAKEAYLKGTWVEENGSFSTLMKEYLRVLKENDYRLTEKVDEYRKDAVALF